MASVTTTTTSAAAAAASITTTPSPSAAASISPSAAAAKRPFLAGDDAPWRVSASGAGFRPVPRIHQSPLLRVAQDHTTAHAMAVMKHQEPIGEGLALEAVVEAAGPECIVPGQPAPLRLLGLKVWPVDMEFKFMEPIGRELDSVRKFMDKSCSVMSSSSLPNK